MFQVNDIVRYGMSGVCKISEVIVRNIGGEQQEYFVLRPVHDARSTLFVPLNNDLLMGRMQTVLSKQDIQDLMDAIPTLDSEWIKEDALRRTRFKEILQGDDRTQLAMLIKMVYKREQFLRNSGKKLRLDDEKTLRTAEKLLYDELAFVLQSPTDQVSRLMREKME